MTRSSKIYVILCSIFCTIIVTGNLIFQKFVTITIFSNVMELSVGVLLFPITFLISDLVTEFYGKEGGRLMIKIAVLCSLMVFGLVMIADYCSATEWSAVDDKVFHSVFNVYGVGAVASIIANYCGQWIDIYIYAYLKKMTRGSHLWFRNNVSTIVGQGVDSFIVLFILSYFEIIPSSQFLIIFLSSFSFKVLAAILDTPFCYLGCCLIRMARADLDKVT